MPLTEGKRSLNFQDIWIAYAESLLKENPAWISRRDRCIKHCRLYEVADGVRREVLNYMIFVRTMEHYFDKAKLAIIRGEAFSIGANVGKIVAKRVERDFRKKKQQRINWHKTKQQPLVWSEEKQRMEYKNIIYHTDKDWCRIGWVKHNKIENETFYEFEPAGPNSAGTSGFRKEFSSALMTDPLLKFQYLFTPVNYEI